MKIKIRRATITRAKGHVDPSTKLKRYELSNIQNTKLTNALLDANIKNTEKSS